MNTHGHQHIRLSDMLDLTRKILTLLLMPFSHLPLSKLVQSLPRCVEFA